MAALVLHSFVVVVAEVALRDAIRINANLLGVGARWIGASP